MDRKYNLKLDLQFRCNNSTMKFNQFDNNTSDFFMRITNGGNLVDIEKAIVVLATIKPSGKVASQFVEVENGLVYADLKTNMKDEIGTYTAQAMLILEDERVVTDTINYEVNESKILSAFIEDAGNQEDYNLLTNMLSRLSTIEILEEQRQINEAERILAEENRKIEEAKRVEAELIRQHEEADRAKYDAIRESNENIRKINEETRISSENVRLENEANRIEQEANRVKAEQLRKDNYNFMTEDEERRKSEANAHKEAEVLRVQAETNRVNEEAKRRTTEQARVSAENTRVNNENTRKANEIAREKNETHRVEAETQRQNRYNSFILDAEANASNFENYTNTAKVKEEERKSNELDRKSQEDRRVSNEVERISNENTRKANEIAREKNETSRQNIFENKVDEVDEKIVEIDNTKDNFISSINTKVDTKISELDNAKSDMTTTVSNKVNEVETRFNALTSSQQQDAEVIDARDGETSLKARLDRDIEKAKEIYVPVEGNHISTDSSVGYAKNVEILGNTVQDTSNLADIRSVGDKVEGQELYEIPVLSRGKNLFDGKLEVGYLSDTDGTPIDKGGTSVRSVNFTKLDINKTYKITNDKGYSTVWYFYDANYNFINQGSMSTRPSNCVYVKFRTSTSKNENDVSAKFQIEEGTVATSYEPYQEDKLTILSPVQLEKVGDVADRIIEKDGVLGVEKNVDTVVLNGSENWLRYYNGQRHVNCYYVVIPNVKEVFIISNKFKYGEKAWDNESEDCMSGHISGVIYVAKQDIASESDFKQWLQANPTTVKYVTTQPQFIPLPHDQQIKLRTFANKTNISFLTEIEGTIKAQVPKSLGATVNTHTEQINNLNKELDRVKKLEESTVSTVTTESDFTTVEATSNGYFEDVKLEGKTLVNIHPKATPAFSTSDKDNPKYNVTKKEGYIKVTGSDLEATNYRYVNMGRVNFEIFKPNTTYTVVFTKLKGVHKIALQNSDSRYSLINSTVDIQDNKLLYTLVTKKTLEKSEQILYLWLDSSLPTVDLEIENPMIFEGDLTTNPPSGYIEGLKSVGENTDEIVVSSVKGDGNLIDLNNAHSKYCTISNDSIIGRNEYNDVQFYVYLEKGAEYFFNSDGSHDFEGNIMYGMQKSYNASATLQFLINLKTKPFTFIGDTGLYTFHIPNFRGIVKDIQLVKGTTPKPYTPYQADKKRLLYYNEETQTWEKPILREWDSIEKHANGKYYYHQRSAEVVLNGSENFGLGTVKSNTIGFTYNCPGAKQDGNVIATHFQKGSYYKDVECVHLATNNIIFFRILNTKLSTQDITGFKAWLQANNVTVVYQLAEEKVYECTNIDLITYANETNYLVESGVLSPKTTLKVHNNISNVVSLLQKKVSLLESNMTKYMITQNRLMLASRYNADTVSFKVDVATLRNSFEYDNDLYELILNNILVGKDNYNREYIENLIIFYWMDFIISDEMYSTLFEIIEEQHNPKIEEETPLI